MNEKKIIVFSLIIFYFYIICITIISNKLNDCLSAPLLIITIGCIINTHYMKKNRVNVLSWIFVYVLAIVAGIMLITGEYNFDRNLYLFCISTVVLISTAGRMIISYGLG